PVMNKAVRFAREKEPELVAERERMTAEINQLRAENHYELYRPFYEAELKNSQEIEELSTQAETPRTRQRWYAQEKLLFLQQKMQQALLQDRKSTRLNSSHVKISYAVFCLKKKKPQTRLSK